MPVHSFWTRSTIPSVMKSGGGGLTNFGVGAAALTLLHVEHSLTPNADHRLNGATLWALQDVAANRVQREPQSCRCDRLGTTRTHIDAAY